MSNDYATKTTELDDDLDIASIPKIDISSLYSSNFSPLTTADVATFNNMNYTSGLHSYGNVTINSGSATTNPHVGSYVYTGSNTSGPLYTSNGTNWSINTNPGLHVKADAEFEGDIKWKGRSLGKLLEKIEDRLAILQEPDAEKLEKFAALKKAYDHYKTLERLIGDD
jgi:hypothetical protein